MRQPFQPLDSLCLQRILEKNLHLHDQVFERLLRLGALVSRRRCRRVRTRAGETVGASGNRCSLRGASKNVLDESGIDLAFELRDAFLIAIVVRIDVDELVENIASFFEPFRGEEQIEKAHQCFEILRFAIQVLENAGHRLR